MAEGSRTSLLRSISEGVRTIVIVTDRLKDLQQDAKELHEQVRLLSAEVARLSGRLEAIDQRFTEVDKRVELAIKLAVREEIERLNRSRNAGCTE